jgi:nucleoside-diphosphate-sugar epimerase
MTHDMDIVLTGATGFVGQHILRDLLDRGHTVRALVREPARLDNIPGVHVVHTPDLFADPRLEEHLAAHTLIHAAWYAEPGKYLTSPINLACLTGTLALAQAFAAAGGRRFVGIGTCAEYDPTPGLLSVDSPIAPANLYAACKAATAVALRSFLANEGIDFAWCRLFYLYGDGEDERRLVPYLRRQLSSGEEVLLSRGDQIRDFIDVKDAAHMIADIALGERQGPVNVCSGQGITVRQLAEQIADEYGRRDLLRFGAKPDNLFDPPRVVGIR